MITTVCAADLPELLPLLRAYCGFYGTNPDESALSEMSLTLVAHPEQGMQLIARSGDGDAVGFATLLWSWDTTVAGRIGIMHDLYVSPAARGQGIADALIEACARASSDQQCRLLKWQTAVDNLRAQAVYRRTGAEDTPWLEFVLPLSATAATVEL